jgi:hypothetical protein
MPREKIAPLAEAPTQGDIVRKVKLCGLSRSSKPLRAWKDCPEVDALVDTGATCTIITRTLAELAGAEILPNAQILHGRPRDAAWMIVQLKAPGCHRSKHLVVVDDRVAATAGPRAFMILGHDYLRARRARIDYGSDHLLSCPSRRSRS